MRRRPVLLGSRGGRIAAAILSCIALATLVGLAVLWPGGEPEFEPTVIGGVLPAEVLSVAGEETCRATDGPGCRVLQVRIGGDGRSAGREGTVPLPGDEATPPVEPGDQIRVGRIFDEQLLGTPDAAGQAQVFTFVDFERRPPLLALAAIFLLLVALLGRRHGLRALAGLAASVVVLLTFVVPAILEGQEPLAVALVGALAVMLLTIGLAHVIGVKSAAAMLGTSAALVITVGLAVVAVELTHITGAIGEDAFVLRVNTGGDVSLQGLVLAGIVVGALGVLDDVTVSQSSTVLALLRADPTQSLRAVFTNAMDVGRDHLGATVNTLALAYAGAALPALLIFEAQSVGAGDALNREPVTAAIVGALVGSIGLLAAVPLTTLLAALLARSVPVEDLPEGHAHHHH